jgi:putative transposase
MEGSVSELNAPAVVAYIEKQEEHLRKMTFEDEFRLILHRHRVQFDEPYVLD